VCGGLSGSNTSAGVQGVGRPRSRRNAAREEPYRGVSEDRACEPVELMALASLGDGSAATSDRHCPRCGLRVAQRFRTLAIRHCPRCLARHHALVELCSSDAVIRRPSGAGGLERLGCAVR